MAMPVYPEHHSSPASGTLRASNPCAVTRILRFNTNRTTQFSFGRLPPGIQYFGDALGRVAKQHKRLPGLAVNNPNGLRSILQSAAKIERGQADEAVRWLFNVGVLMEVQLQNGEEACFVDRELLERIVDPRQLSLMRSERQFQLDECTLLRRAQELVDQCQASQDAPPNSGEQLVLSAEDAAVALMEHVKEIPLTNIKDAVYQPDRIISDTFGISQGEARGLLTQAIEQGLLYPIGTSGTWAVFADGEDAVRNLSQAIATRQEERDKTERLLAEQTVQSDVEERRALAEQGESWDDRVSNLVLKIQGRFNSIRSRTEHEILAERDQQLEAVRLEYERRVREIEATASGRLENMLSEVARDCDRETVVTQKRLSDERQRAEEDLRKELRKRAEEQRQPLIERIKEFDRELERLRRI